MPIVHHCQYLVQLDTSITCVDKKGVKNVHLGAIQIKVAVQFVFHVLKDIIVLIQGANGFNARQVCYSFTNFLTRRQRIPSLSGTYSGMGQSECTRCPNGYFTVRPGSTYCDICPKGHFCSKADQPPIPCPAGRYAESFGQIACTPCNNGHYSTGIGAASCNWCSPGHYCADATANPRECELGTFSIGGQSQCSECPWGTYAIRKGSTFCQMCGPGKLYCLIIHFNRLRHS